MPLIPKHSHYSAPLIIVSINPSSITSFTPSSVYPILPIAHKALLFNKGDELLFKNYSFNIYKYLFYFNKSIPDLVFTNSPNMCGGSS